MFRRLITFFLMLCLCWQSLAYAGAGVLVAEGEELTHAVMHFEGHAHHHDGHSGAFHQDGSPDSMQHGMDDACVYAPALLADLVLPLLVVGADAPMESLSSDPPLPFLLGLERPPKLNA